MLPFLLFLFLVAKTAMKPSIQDPGTMKLKLPVFLNYYRLSMLQVSFQFLVQSRKFYIYSLKVSTVWKWQKLNIQKSITAFTSLDFWIHRENKQIHRNIWQNVCIE